MIRCLFLRLPLLNFTSAALAKCGDKGDNGSWTDKNNNYFTAEQMLRWYKQQLYTYTPENTEEAMDQLVSELVEAKVEVAYMHGRGDHDKVHNVDDRLYTGGPGAFGSASDQTICRRGKTFTLC